MRRLLLLSIVLLVTPALPGVAGAHVDVAPTSAPAGKPVKLNLSVGHGCDGAATTTLTVRVPKSAEKSRASSTPGWRATNKPWQMKWTGGPLPDEGFQEYPFTMTAYGKKGEKIPFKAIQGCEGGKQTAWIQPTPASGAEPENPAPIVTLTSSAKKPAPATPESGADKSAEDQPAASAVPASSEEDEGLADGLIIAIFAIAAVGLISGGLYWARRNGSGD